MRSNILDNHRRRVVLKTSGHYAKNLWWSKVKILQIWETFNNLRGGHVPLMLKPPDAYSEPYLSSGNTHWILLLFCNYDVARWETIGGWEVKGLPIEPLRANPATVPLHYHNQSSVESSVFDYAYELQTHSIIFFGSLYCSLFYFQRQLLIVL